MEKDQYLLSSAHNCLQILDLLSKKEHMGVAEIGKAMNLGKASVFRMLYTLEKAGFVQKSEDAKYSLGIKFALYGSLVVDRQSIVQVAGSFLEHLRDTFNETAYLSMLTSSGNMVFISRQYSGSSLQMYARMGEERDAYCTASGKAMLAYIDPERSEKFARGYKYTAFTGNTLTCAEDLMHELAEVRANGYAVDREENEIGLVCYSAPLFDHRGNCVAAMSLSGPTTRMYARRAEFIEGVLQASRAVSNRLGYQRKKFEG